MEGYIQGYKILWDPTAVSEVTEANCTRDFHINWKLFFSLNVFDGSILFSQWYLLLLQQQLVTIIGIFTL